MAVAKGRAKGEKENPLGERIDFVGPVLTLESLRASITARTLERLQSSWDVNFGKLQKFKDENGHCRVTQLSKNHKLLGSWVSRQRILYSRGVLSSDRVSKLESAGFIWDVFTAEWERKFNLLKDYKEMNGDCLVVSRKHELGAWVTWIRRQYSKGKLTGEQISRLDHLGFAWDPLIVKWEIMFKNLLAYKQFYGNCRLVSKSGEYKDLGVWVAMHRQAYKKNKIPKDRISRLEEIGFEWDIYQSDWEYYFSQLVSYQTEYGHCRVPSGWKENKSLASWVITQREYYSNGEMPSERIARLEKLGFDWNPRDSDWKNFYEDLKIYKSIHGHCRVPDTYKPSPSLGKWVANQRTNRKKGLMSLKHIALLDEIGFFWGK